jgi:hypothetical protein
LAAIGGSLGVYLACLQNGWFTWAQRGVGPETLLAVLDTGVAYLGFAGLEGLAAFALLAAPLVGVAAARERRWGARGQRLAGVGAVIAVAVAARLWLWGVVSAIWGLQVTWGWGFDLPAFQADGTVSIGGPPLALEAAALALALIAPSLPGWAGMLAAYAQTRWSRDRERIHEDDPRAPAAPLPAGR